MVDRGEEELDGRSKGEAHVAKSFSVYEVNEHAAKYSLLKIGFKGAGSAATPEATMTRDEIMECMLGD